MTPSNETLKAYEECVKNLAVAEKLAKTPEDVNQIEAMRAMINILVAIAGIEPSAEVLTKDEMQPATHGLIPQIFTRDEIQPLPRKNISPLTEKGFDGMVAAEIGSSNGWKRYNPPYATTQPDPKDATRDQETVDVLESGLEDKYGAGTAGPTAEVFDGGKERKGKTYQPNKASQPITGKDVRTGSVSHIFAILARSPDGLSYNDLAQRLYDEITQPTLDEFDDLENVLKAAQNEASLGISGIRELQVRIEKLQEDLETERTKNKNQIVMVEEAEAEVEELADDIDYRNTRIEQYQKQQKVLVADSNQMAADVDALEIKNKDQLYAIHCLEMDVDTLKARNENQREQIEENEGLENDLFLSKADFKAAKGGISELLRYLKENNHGRKVMEDSHKEEVVRLTKRGDASAESRNNAWIKANDLERSLEILKQQSTDQVIQDQKILSEKDYTIEHLGTQVKYFQSIFETLKVQHEEVKARLAHENNKDNWYG